MIAFGPSILDDLIPIAEEYVNAREVCSKQRERLRSHAKEFDQWNLIRQEDRGYETDSARLSAWLAELAERLAPATVNGRRTSILSLVRFGTEDGEPLPRADRIRRQKEPEKINPAFTLAEIRQMLAAAPSYQPVTVRTFGRGICGDVIPRTRPDGIAWADWWTAFIHVGYESGQYLSDLRNIPWDVVGSDGAVSFVRHKTGRAMSFRLSKQAIRSARQLGHERLLLPWQFDLGSYFPREWRKFAAFAGVRPLGSKSLRRSALTYTYMAQGEEAARILAGHASFSTTAKHYIDWSIARRPIVSPPPL